MTHSTCDLLVEAKRLEISLLAARRNSGDRKSGETSVVTIKIVGECEENATFITRKLNSIQLMQQEREGL